MRSVLVTWLLLTLAASAQTGGFGGSSGGGSSGSGLGGGSSSSGFTGGSGTSNSSLNAGVSSQTLLNSFGTGSSSRNNSSVASSNPFATYYYNPYAQGLISGSGTSTTVMGFGQAVFSTSATGGGSGGRTNSGVSGGFGSTSSLGSGGTRTTGTGTGSSSGLSGGLGGSSTAMGMVGGTGGSTGGGFGGANLQNAGGRNAGNTSAGLGATGGFANTGLASSNRAGQSSFAPAASIGLKRGILYTTNIGFPVAQVPIAQTQARLSDVITRSTKFAAPGNVRLAFEQGTVFLRGTVASEDEAIRAENLIRLEPGVRDVRNELQIRP